MPITTLVKDPTPPAGFFDENGDVSTKGWNLLIDILNGLVADKIVASAIAGGNVSDVEFDFLNGVNANIQNQFDTIVSALSGKQPIHANLTAIAGITFLDNDILQRKAGALINRAPAQFKVDLSLVKGDVGLGNVDNTTDLGKPVSTATQAELDGKSAVGHLHAASDVNSGTFDIARIPLGTSASTVCVGNDTRLSDARTPLSHTHTKTEISDTGTWEESEIPNLPASKITSGQFPIARLASGTPDGTKFIRDDGVLASVAGGSTNIKQTEIDFGSVPLRNKRFTITDAEVGASNQIMASVSYDDPSDGELDSAEWFEELTVMAKAGAGEFYLYAHSPYQDTNGKVKINYLIG